MSAHPAHRSECPCPSPQKVNRTVPSVVFPSGRLNSLPSLPLSPPLLSVAIRGSRRHCCGVGVSYPIPSGRVGQLASNPPPSLLPSHTHVPSSPPTEVGPCDSTQYLRRESHAPLPQGKAGQLLIFYRPNMPLWPLPEVAPQQPSLAILGFTSPLIYFPKNADSVHFFRRKVGERSTEVGPDQPVGGGDFNSHHIRNNPGFEVFFVFFSSSFSFFSISVSRVNQSPILPFFPRPQMQTKRLFFRIGDCFQRSNSHHDRGSVTTSVLGKLD